jgi:hypothetical protein
MTIMKIEDFLKLVAQQNAGYKLGRQLRQGSLASFQKKRPKQVVPDELLAP